MPERIVREIGNEFEFDRNEAAQLHQKLLQQIETLEKKEGAGDLTPQEQESLKMARHNAGELQKIIDGGLPHGLERRGDRAA